ncbi:hypothetical protein GGR57DRAFT_458613 [Xylariaceae sp. FL1272]|nr:hypothetical protein GGR57DRAFT_458613 [Xylariaceae sp. FL1272]
MALPSVLPGVLIPGLGRIPYIVGNDICHIPRIKSILGDAGRGRDFIKRVLHREEITHPRTARILQFWLKGKIKGDKDSLKPSAILSEHGYNRAAEFMAGRFSAKEAIIKAHPLHKLSLNRISLVPMQTLVTSEPVREALREVMKDDSPTSVKDYRYAYLKRPLVARFDQDGLTAATVSISHDGDYATAVCVAVAQPPLPPPPPPRKIEKGSSGSLDSTSRTEIIRSSISSLITGLENQKEAVEGMALEKVQQIGRLLEELQSVSQAIDSEEPLESGQDVDDVSHLSQNIAKLTDKIRLLTSQIEEQTDQEEQTHEKE